MVTIKFIAPAIEEVPAKCRLKIAMSTEAPLWPAKLANGGYTVQPVPTPTSIKLEVNKQANDGGNNQKLKLFNLAKAISGAPINIGTNQLPKPPIKIGITIKNIITNAWEVTNTLYNWWLPNNIWFAGAANSSRICTDNAVPTIPEKVPKIKYKVPMSLWLVENNHLSIHILDEL